MASFISHREAKERAKQLKEEKRNEKLKYKDLRWAAKRRFLDDSEWAAMHILHRTYGEWGPEQSEYEFGVLEEMREFFRRNQVGSKSPAQNALERHLAMHAEKQIIEEKQKKKPIVKATATKKKVAA